MNKYYQWNKLQSKKYHFVNFEEVIKELQIFKNLLKCWSFTGYNPKGKYWNVSFTIRDGKLANDLNTIASNIIDKEIKITYKEVKND